MALVLLPSFALVLVLALALVYVLALVLVPSFALAPCAVVAVSSSIAWGLGHSLIDRRGVRSDK